MTKRIPLEEIFTNKEDLIIAKKLLSFIPSRRPVEKELPNGKKDSLIHSIRVGKGTEISHEYVANILDLLDNEKYIHSFLNIQSLHYYKI